MFTTHAYLLAGPVLAVAALFGLERHLGSVGRWVVTILLVPLVLALIAFLSYGQTGGILYAISVLPIYAVGIAFGWRCAHGCKQKEEAQ